MRISDWSSDVCSSDLQQRDRREQRHADAQSRQQRPRAPAQQPDQRRAGSECGHRSQAGTHNAQTLRARRSEEHTSELQSLMRLSYAVFCLKQKTTLHTITMTQRIPYITKTNIISLSSSSSN